LSIQNVTEESFNSCLEQIILNLKLLVLDKFEFFVIIAGAGMDLHLARADLGYPKFEQKWFLPMLKFSNLVLDLHLARGTPTGGPGGPRHSLSRPTKTCSCSSAMCSSLVA
jgi:hypothetical protein